VKITKQEKKGNKVILEIEEDYSSLEARIESVINNASKELHVPGFRKGKVPKNIAEQHFDKDAIIQRAVQNLVSDLYPGIIKEAAIEPVDYPNVVILKNEEGKPFAFSVEVEVYPEVKLGKYKGIKADSESKELTEEEINSFIEDLRFRVADIEEVKDRAVQKDDIVDIEIKASSAGSEINTLSGKNVKLLVGQGYILPEFDDQLIGVKTGEKKTFALKVPEKHPVKEIAGKDITFEVTVGKINQKKLPELNDEFARKMAGTATLEAFMGDVKKRLAEAKTARIESDLKNKLIAEVAKGISVDIPEGMMRREVDLMLDELKGNIARDNITFDDYLKMTKKTEQQIKDELKGAAEGRVKSKLALKAVADKEKLEVSDEELKEEINILSNSSGQKPEQFIDRIGDAGLEHIRDYLLRRNALEFVMSNAKISEKKKK